MRNIRYSWKRFREAKLSTALARKPFRIRSLRAFIRLLVFTIVLCPMFALYMFGLFVSPWISLWRLVQQDYVTAGDSNGAGLNLEPALVVLYSLALLQGLLFYYKAISSLEENRLVKLVSEEYALPEDDEAAAAARRSIKDYLREVRAGCEKDPSFARGKNLVTFAVGQMESNSPENYYSGARVLDMLIRLPDSRRSMRVRHGERIDSMARSASDDRDAGAGPSIKITLTQLSVPTLKAQRTLINSLIGSASSGKTIKKLIYMLDSKSQFDDKIRLCALRIVAHFADEIRLNKIPSAIQCIFSFLKDRTEKDRQYPTSIDILSKLTGDLDNSRLMSSTSGFTLKIIELLGKSHPDTDSESSSDDEHDEQDEHAKWCKSIAVPGMQVIKRLVSGDNKTQLRREISEGTGAIKTLEERMLKLLCCGACNLKQDLEISVIEILTEIIPTGTSSSEVDDDRKNSIKDFTNKFIESLIQLFIPHNNRSGDIGLRVSAGRALAQLCLKPEISIEILKTKTNSDSGIGNTNSDSGIVGDLIKVLLDTNCWHRFIAADILKNLCKHYIQDDDNFNKLKVPMISAIKKVLGELLCSGQYDLSYITKEAFSSLCTTVNERLISADNDMDTRIGAEICRDMPKPKATPVLFSDLVKEAAELVKKIRGPWMSDSDDE